MDKKWSQNLTWRRSGAKTCPRRNSGAKKKDVCGDQVEPKPIITKKGGKLSMEKKSGVKSSFRRYSNHPINTMKWNWKQKNEPQKNANKKNQLKKKPETEKKRN